jgi:hypothetical protein
MAYDEYLAERIRIVLNQKSVSFEEKKMMGGLCFMVNDKMCVGIVKDSLMARIGSEMYESALAMQGCRKMDFSGKPLRGFVFLDPDAIDMDNDLIYWIQKCLDFNPQARSSKKK